MTQPPSTAVGHTHTTECTGGCHGSAFVNGRTCPATHKAVKSLPRCLDCNYSIRGEAYNVWVVQPRYNVALGIEPVTASGPFHHDCAERRSTST